MGLGLYRFLLFPLDTAPAVGECFIASKSIYEYLLRDFYGCVHKVGRL